MSTKMAEIELRWIELKIIRNLDTTQYLSLNLI